MFKRQGTKIHMARDCFLLTRISVIKRNRSVCQHRTRENAVEDVDTLICENTITSGSIVPDSDDEIIV